jgi:hypothetical protein
VFSGVSCFLLLRFLLLRFDDPHTLLGYRCNPEGIEYKDGLLFAVSFAITLSLVALYSLL